MSVLVWRSKCGKRFFILYRYFCVVGWFSHILWNLLQFSVSQCVCVCSSSMFMFVCKCDAAHKYTSLHCWYLYVHITAHRNITQTHTWCMYVLVYIFADFMSQNISLLPFLLFRWFAFVFLPLFSSFLSAHSYRLYGFILLVHRWISIVVSRFIFQKFLARGPENTHTHTYLHHIHKEYGIHVRCTHTKQKWRESNNFYSMLHKTSTKHTHNNGT